MHQIYMYTASKIVFTNGSQDPWRHASKQKSSKDSESSRAPSPYIYERLIALCKYFALDRGCFVFLCIDRCPTTHAVPSYIMKCRNCGHGTDLRGCPQWPFRIEGNSKRKEINGSIKLCYDRSAILTLVTGSIHQSAFLSVFYSVVT